MSGPDVLTREDVQLHTGSNPAEVAHIVDQRPASGQDVTTAYIEGSELTALCGYRWVPARSPDSLPICAGCKTIVADMAGVLRS